uniref:Glutathione synthetase, chloroplastic n=1 Tax=Aegilops tauschii subsp. strangulata TaxID=200361 RepID=A0A453K138_AEGTS
MRWRRWRGRRRRGARCTGSSSGTARTRDQEQFLGLGWSTLQSPCSRRVSRSPSGARRASWPRFSTSSWIVLAWMGISCRIPCPSEFRCHVNLSTFSFTASACKLTRIKEAYQTRQVDDFTSRLLDIHRKMMDANKKENIRLGLHRSDYMLDSETNSLLQIELNTISVSFPGLCSIVTELHRTLINQYGNLLCLDAKRVPGNEASRQFAKALAKAWDEFNVDRIFFPNLLHMA